MCACRVGLGCGGTMVMEGVVSPCGVCVYVHTSLHSEILLILYRGKFLLV